MGHVENYRAQLSAAIDAVNEDAINAWIQRSARARSEQSTITAYANDVSYDAVFAEQ